MIKSKVIKYPLFWPLLIIAILTGCGVPSVHPLYEPGDLITKKELTGTWTFDGEDRFVIFNVQDLKNNPAKVRKELSSYLDSTEKDQSIKDIKNGTDVLIKKGLEKLYYVLKVNNKEMEKLYFGGIVKLNSQLYVDLYQVQFFGNDAFRFPTHAFAKLDIQKDKLTLYEFRTNFIKDLIKKRQIRIKHEYENDQFLLTAPSKELQKFILKYGNIHNAYGKTRVYHKVTSYD